MNGLTTPDRDLGIIPDLEPKMEFLYGRISDDNIDPIPLRSLGGDCDTDCLPLEGSIDSNVDGDGDVDGNSDGSGDGNGDGSGDCDIEFDSKDNDNFSFCKGEFG